MHIEVLAIGEEFLTGSLVDTNSAYIVDQCISLGLEVKRLNCIGDNLTAIQSILQEITKRANILIITGGLGPTPDDITRLAAARAANVDLIFCPAALTEIEAFFAKLKITMPESNQIQSMLPQGSQYLPNPIGTAPGFTMQIGKAECFFMPGVPREMRRMLHEQTIPIIKQKFSAQLEQLITEEINTFGLSEAIIGEHLRELAKEFPKVKFGTRATFPTVQIKFYIYGANILEQKRICDQVNFAIQLRIGVWIFGKNSQTLPEIIIKLLQQSQASIAILEIENGGLIGDWLTKNELHSQHLAFAGVINRKNKFLANGNKENLSNTKFTQGLAEKILRLTEATYGLAIHGITTKKEAEILGEEIGTVHIAIATKNSTQCYSIILDFGNKESKKNIFAILALDILRRKLLSLDILERYFGKSLVKKATC